MAWQVLSDMCLDNRTSHIRIPVADDLHWAACCRLVCVEANITTAMYIASSKQDPTLFPWLFLLLLDLTVVYCKRDASCPEAPHDHGTGSILYTGVKSHVRQLQKLGESLSHMCNDWSPWKDLLPDSYFDTSAQKHVLKQLLQCITSASKVNVFPLLHMFLQGSVLLMSDNEPALSYQKWCASCLWPPKQTRAQTFSQISRWCL